MNPQDRQSKQAGGHKKKTAGFANRQEVGYTHHRHPAVGTAPCHSTVAGTLRIMNINCGAAIVGAVAVARHPMAL
ncbi:MAG: hypothetical protein ACP5IL_16070 [Syntrophobacteraceae bacterium]